MSTQITEHQNKYFSELADDYFYNFVIIKSSDSQNKSILFLQAHILELSVKAYCLNKSVSYSDSNGHDIKTIYNRIINVEPTLQNLMPSNENFQNYKSVFLPGNSLNSEVIIPIKSPNEIYFLELAFIIDNVMNLKYGFTRQNVQLSRIELSYEKINSQFLALFNFCRDGYKTDQLNSRILEKFYRQFGKSVETQAKIKALINV